MSTRARNNTATGSTVVWALTVEQGRDLLVKKNEMRTKGASGRCEVDCTEMTTGLARPPTEGEYLAGEN